MEGNYLTKDQRMQAAQQIRKTHFVLGDGINRYNTTSAEFLKSHNPSIESKNDYKKNKDLKKSHLIIGNSNNCKRISEFKDSYSPKTLNRINPSFVKLDLTKHNTILGTVDTNYKTTTSFAFKKNADSIKVDNSIKDLENNLRNHHFKFGSDNITKTSTFKSEFVKKNAEKTENLEDLKKDLTNSHFELGRAPLMMKTTFQHEFLENSKKESNQLTRSVLDLRKEHFCLGNYQNKISSTNEQCFRPQTPNKQNIDQEKFNDLRSSHFVLGQSSPS